MIDRRSLAKLSVWLVLLLVFDLTDILSIDRNAEFFRSSGYDAVDMFNHMGFGFSNFDTILIETVFFQTAFIMLFPLFAGQDISSELTVSATYYFTRRASRSKWYLKRVLMLFIKCMLVSFVACFINYLMTMKISENVQITPILCEYSIFCLYCFILTLAANIAAIFTGSIISVVISSAFHIMSILLLKSSTIFGRYNLLGNCVITLSSTANEFVIKLSIELSVAVIITVVGLLIIKNKELGLVNAEQII